MNEALREPTADELDILRQFGGVTNGYVSSVSRWHRADAPPDIPDNLYLKTTIVGHKTDMGWRFEATFWATSAGRTVVKRLSTGQPASSTEPRDAEGR